MTRRTPLPEPLDELPFRGSAAQARGVSRVRLRASDLDRPFHGVRVAHSSPQNLVWRCRAYQEWMNPKHAFSHATAAALYQLPLPAYALAAGLHVSAPFPLRAPAGKGVFGHQVAQSLWARRDIIPEEYLTDHLFAFTALTPELVWAQLAGTLDVADLVAIGDAIVGGGRPIGTIAGLREMTEACTGRRGAHAMAAAVRLVRVGSLSRPESLLRLILVRAGIPEPVLNLQVTDGLGRPISMAERGWRSGPGELRQVAGARA